jgi:hypothetical protein
MKTTTSTQEKPTSMRIACETKHSTKVPERDWKPLFGLLCILTSQLVNI